MREHILLAFIQALSVEMIHATQVSMERLSSSALIRLARAVIRDALSRIAEFRGGIDGFVFVLCVEMILLTVGALVQTMDRLQTSLVAIAVFTIDRNQAGRALVGVTKFLHGVDGFVETGSVEMVIGLGLVETIQGH